MNLTTKIFTIGAIVLGVSTTMQSMTASNQFDSADLESLSKISVINESMTEQEIGMASFMNNEVTLIECEKIFQENNFKHLNYDSCNEFIEDLHISALDKKQTNKQITEKNTLPSVI